MEARSCYYLSAYGGKTSHPLYGWSLPEIKKHTAESKSLYPERDQGLPWNLI
jgi:hypothetical protein